MKYQNGITAVIRSLGGGGAERVLATMLNFWAEEGRPVTVVTTSYAVEHAYSLHANIRCITIPPIDASNMFDNCPWNVRHLRQIIETEGNFFVLSFMEKSNLPCILASMGLSIKLIIAERTDPRMQAEYSDYKKSLIQGMYPHADALVVQTQNVKQNWADAIMPHGKTHVIPNMVNIDTSAEHTNLHLPHTFLCCMGRLTACKGLTGLIDQLPYIFSQHPEYSLVVLGEGPDRPILTAQLASLGLMEKVFLPGFLRAPHSILKKSSIFILPSIFEGFPNALIEAMAVGLPCVSFACPSGPSEIIHSGYNGFLIPPQQYRHLAEKVIELLSDPAQLKEIGNNARTDTQKKYNAQSIMQKWNGLLYTL